MAPHGDPAAQGAMSPGEVSNVSHASLNVVRSFGWRHALNGIHRGARPESDVLICLRSAEIQLLRRGRRNIRQEAERVEQGDAIDQPVSERAARHRSTNDAESADR